MVLNSYGGLVELAAQLMDAKAKLLEQTSDPIKVKNQPRAPRRKNEARNSPPKRRPRVTVDPDATTKPDLLQKAKRAGVSGYSHMTKAELAKALS